MSESTGGLVSDALEAFEAAHDVRIVAARDLGSHAWGLAGPESDRDVAVLFAQRPLEYATLDDYVSHLEFQSGADDCFGWNVRRFAELLSASNPTALEFLHSPLRYREFEPLARLEADVGESFEPLALYHHYRSLATRQYRKYLQGRLLEDGSLAYYVLEERADGYLAVPATERDADPVRIDEGVYEEAATDRTVKRHLYVARGVLYAQYVEDARRFPPLEFPQFLEREGGRSCFDPEFVERVRWLVARKLEGHGDDLVGRLFEPEDVELPPPEPTERAGRGIERGRLDDFVRGAIADVGRFDAD